MQKGWFFRLKKLPLRRLFDRLFINLFVGQDSKTGFKQEII